MEYSIAGIFPTPVYIGNRESDLDSIEEKEIEDIIKGGMIKNECNNYCFIYILSRKIYFNFKV